MVEYGSYKTLFVENTSYAWWSETWLSMICLQLACLEI